MNSKDSFEVIKTMMSTAISKLDSYYIKFQTTYISSLMDAMLVPTKF